MLELNAYLTFWYLFTRHTTIPNFTHPSKHLYMPPPRQQPDQSTSAIA